MLDIMLCLHAEHGGGQQLDVRHAGADLVRHRPLFHLRGGHRVASRGTVTAGEPSGAGHAGGNKTAGEALGRRRRSGRLPGQDSEPGGVRQDGLGLRHGACRVHEVRPARRHLQAFRRETGCRHRARGGVQPAQEHRTAGAGSHSAGKGHAEGHVREHRHVLGVRVFAAGHSGRPVHASVRLRAHVGLGGAPLRGNRVRQAHHPPRLQKQRAAASAPTRLSRSGSALLVGMCAGACGADGCVGGHQRMCPRARHVSRLRAPRAVRPQANGI